MSYDLRIYVYKVDGSPQPGVSACLFTHRIKTGLWYKVCISTSSVGRASFLSYLDPDVSYEYYYTLDYGDWHYVSVIRPIPSEDVEFTNTVGESSPPRSSSIITAASEDLGGGNYKITGYLIGADQGLNGRMIDLYVDGVYKEGCSTGIYEEVSGYFEFYPEPIPYRHLITLKFSGDAWFYASEYSFYVGPLPPTATLSASPSSGIIPLAVTFTIGIRDGYTPYAWTLDYGDGSTPDSGTIVGTKSHTYTTVGTFTATLTVTDALGASVYSRSVTYAGVLPIPDIVSLISGLAPLIAVASVVAASELQRAHVFG